VQGVNGSIVTPVDTWLKGLCARGPCSNDDLAFIVTNVTTGCATDLQLGNTPPSSIVPIVQQIYPTVRKAFCLADAPKNQLCVTQTLSNIETVTGTLTIDKFVMVLTEVTGGQHSSLNGVDLCTPCIKQFYNVFKTDLPTFFNQSDTDALQAACGASFVDGASDPNIIQTASNKSTTGNTSTNTSTNGSAQITGQWALLSAFLLGLLALVI
jgi:hypothetical protein